MTLTNYKNKQIIDNWEYKTLDQMGSVQRGRSKHRPRNDARLFGGQYPFIQTADVKNAPFYISEYTETYNDMGLTQSKLWDIGTLCITIAANIADTGILAIPACFPDSILGFRAYEEISDVRFVKYCFDILQKDCKQISQGTAQDNLSWEKLSTIKFPCPPLEIQRKIADVLSAYDDLIENNRKQIKFLEEAAQRLYKEWFIDLRFPGHETTPIIDGIPAGWERKKLGSIIKLRSGFAFKSKDFCSKGNFKIVTIKNVQDGVFDYENTDTITEIPHNMPKYCILSDGDILLSLTGNIGRVCMVTGKNCLLNQRVAKLETQYPGFAYCLFRNKNFCYSINTLANGAAQQNLSPIKTEEMKVLIPSIQHLSLFEKQIHTITDKILMLYKNIIVTKLVRNYLLPKLMNGELNIID